MDSRDAPSDPVLMRAGVQFITSGPSTSLSLSLSLHELLSDRVLRKTEPVQEEDVQPECFKQRDAPGRILALGLRVKSFGYPTSAGGDAREAGELQRAREKNLESTGLTIAD